MKRIFDGILRDPTDEELKHLASAPITDEPVLEEAEPSKTPLTDSKAFTVCINLNNQGDRVTPVVLTSDSRAIETRLNECVEALIELQDATATLLSARGYHAKRKAHHAITNARKPL
jgi:hypothetical protein